MYQPLKTNHDHSADQHKKKTYVKINEFFQQIISER